MHIPNWPTGTVREVLFGAGIERITSYRALTIYPVVVSYGLAIPTILGPWLPNHATARWFSAAGSTGAIQA
ncbi:MAG: hypothetical protein IPI21_11955 [Propionivibrio sp.]|nr:hypothetical protein [Propionivibrio sp.]